MIFYISLLKNQCKYHFYSTSPYSAYVCPHDSTAAHLNTLYCDESDNTRGQKLHVDSGLHSDLVSGIYVSLLKIHVDCSSSMNSHLILSTERAQTRYELQTGWSWGSCSSIEENILLLSLGLSKQQSEGTAIPFSIYQQLDKSMSWKLPVVITIASQIMFPRLHSRNQHFSKVPLR